MQIVRQDRARTRPRCNEVAETLHYVPPPLTTPSIRGILSRERRRSVLLANSRSLPAATLAASARKTVSQSETDWSLRASHVRRCSSAVPALWSRDESISRQHRC